jgi:hypothetical protein
VFLCVGLSKERIKTKTKRNKYRIFKIFSNLYAYPVWL